jgi:hypothetical protein
MIFLFFFTIPSFVDDGGLGFISNSHIPSTCRSVTLQRFFAVLWTSRYGDPAGNSFFGLTRCGRKGFMIVWRRAIGVDLSDRVDISIVFLCSVLLSWLSYSSYGFEYLFLSAVFSRELW